MKKEKVVLHWSGGKDSALALYALLKEPSMTVEWLLTSVTNPGNRISMHGVRHELLTLQQQRLGIPLITMTTPEMPDMLVYERTLSEVLNKLKVEGATVSAYGDIFLEDLRAYREEQLDAHALKAFFPLWGVSSADLMSQFIELGFKAVITCVNDKYLDQSFAGRMLDEKFLADLPNGVDHCGENGEYHSFVYDGPIFNKPVPYVKGEITYKEYSLNFQSVVGDDKKERLSTRFWYCDLLPGLDV